MEFTEPLENPRLFHKQKVLSSRVCIVAQPMKYEWLTAFAPPDHNASFRDIQRTSIAYCANRDQQT